MLTIPITFRNARPHAHGLIGSPTSELGGGEWYEALPPKEDDKKKRKRKRRKGR